MTLQTWARIAVVLDESLGLEPEDQIELDGLRIDPPGSMQVMYRSKVTGQSSVHFNRVPAGEFTISIHPKASRINGQIILHTLQTNVVLASGENLTVSLGTEGKMVIAHLDVPKDQKDNLLTAVLHRDVPLPPEGYEHYATYRSLQEASRRRETDPIRPTAKREQRSYFGAISPDGTVRFRRVQPGNYILELKQFNSDVERGFGQELGIASEARFPITVGALTEGETEDIGAFSFESALR